MSKRSRLGESVRGLLSDSAVAFIYYSFLITLVVFFRELCAMTLWGASRQGDDFEDHSDTTRVGNAKMARHTASVVIREGLGEGSHRLKVD